MSKVFVVGARGIPDVEGGAEKSAEKLFPLLAARGWRITLVGLREHIRSDHYRGVALRRAPSSRFLKTDKLAYYVAAVFMALRLRPQIVHMQGLGSAIMLWAYKLLGAKTVVRYGSVDYLFPKWGLLGRWGFRFSEYQLRFADAIIAVTPALADRLRSRGIARNIHVLPNAIDQVDRNSELASAEIPEKPYILTVGRVMSAKNLHRLVEAFEAMAADRPELSLVIAGGLDDEDYVRSLRPILTSRVKLLGRLPRSSLGALYTNARLFVNSSLYEGSSNAVLEAISWRCPLVISGIAENRDLGLPSRYYFDPEKVDEIAAALARSEKSPGDYVPDLDGFLTWEDVAARTSGIYEELVGRPARRRAAA
jgi:glycosyltransferase involved in cell wall biosynthesis